MTAFAKALEIIPRQISDNAGLDSTDILNKLRMKHAKGEKWTGVDVDGADGVRNNMDAFVWEPSLVKTNAISSAAEAACLILSVDETVRNPQSEQVSVCVHCYVTTDIENAFCSQLLDHGHHQALHKGRCEAEAEACPGGR